MNKNNIAKKVFSILNVEPNPARNSIFNLFYESVKNEVSKLTYIKRLKDQDIQDKRFIKAFCFALAAILAVGICNNSNLANRLNGEYSFILNSECMNTESSKWKNCPEIQ